MSIEIGEDGTEYNSGIGYLWTDDLMNGTWHYGDNGVEGDILDTGEDGSIIGNNGNIISDTSGRYFRNTDTGEMEFNDFPTYPHGNNHGSMARINGEYYFFGHRHTNANNFSRESVAGKLTVSVGEDGTPVIEPMEFTSSGPADSLDAYEIWDANCTVYLLEAADHQAASMEANNPHSDCAATSPYVKANRDQEADHASYVTNLGDGSIVGYKYLDFGEEQKTLNVKLLVRNVAADATVDICFDAPTEEQGGTKVGTVDLNAGATVETLTATDGTVWTWAEGSLDPGICGTYAVYFVFHSPDGSACDFDQFTFAE